MEVLANALMVNHFAICKYQINMSNTLNFHDVIRQLYLSKAGGGSVERHHNGPNIFMP